MDLAEPIGQLLRPPTRGRARRLCRVRASAGHHRKNALKIPIRSLPVRTCCFWQWKC